VKAYRAARLVTGLPGPDFVREHVTLVFDRGRIVHVTEEFTGDAEPVQLITPGLVDAHTHSAWVGSRHAEYEQRLAGVHYADIAKAGGGIQASRHAIAAATEESIAETLTQRLRRMAQLGVTTVEVKSGYGLLPELELKQLAAIAHVAQNPLLPRVVATALLLHALPAEYRDKRAEYVELMCTQCLPEIARRKLAIFVDAYVDQNAFTVEEAERLACAAEALGLRIRLHVGQFADVGGAQLAARIHAASADHLEHLSPEGAKAMARAGVFAGLLPTACFTLGQTPPPVALLREAGVKMLVASDANPGTAPTESLPLAMAMAARLYGMSLEEIVLGTTSYAAASLGLPDVGSLVPRNSADFTVWDLPHEACLLQPWGSTVARETYVRGVRI
jgi:imidazolonepropionase